MEFNAFWSFGKNSAKTISEISLFYVDDHVKGISVLIYKNCLCLMECSGLVDCTIYHSFLYLLFHFEFFIIFEHVGKYLSGLTLNTWLVSYLSIQVFLWFVHENQIYTRGWTYVYR